jgi:glucose repression regulatory protein TUP1
VVKIFEGHQGTISCLDFSRDGRLIASGSEDDTARIWELEGRQSMVFTIPMDVTSVAISHDSRLLAAGSLDSITRVWDIATGQLLAWLKGHTNSVYSVTFSANGRELITGSLDKTLKYWDITTIIQRVQQGPKMDRTAYPLSRIVTEHHRLGRSQGILHAPYVYGRATERHGQDFVLTVVASKDGNWVVSGSKDQCVHFWDARTGDLRLRLMHHYNSGIFCSFTSVQSMPLKHSFSVIS